MGFISTAFSASCPVATIGSANAVTMPMATRYFMRRTWKRMDFMVILHRVRVTTYTSWASANRAPEGPGYAETLNPAAYAARLAWRAVRRKPPGDVPI